MGSILRLAFLFFLSNYATAQTIHLPGMYGEWKAIRGQDLNDMSFVQYVPLHENGLQWSRILSMQFIPDTKDDLSKVVKRLHFQMLRRCPSANWTLLTQDASSITYEWSVVDCAERPDQAQIARLLQGKEGIHHVAYARMAPKFNAAERSDWLMNLSNAYLEEGQNAKLGVTSQSR